MFSLPTEIRYRIYDYATGGDFTFRTGPRPYAHSQYVENDPNKTLRSLARINRQLNDELPDWISKSCHPQFYDIASLVHFVQAQRLPGLLHRCNPSRVRRVRLYINHDGLIAEVTYPEDMKRLAMHLNSERGLETDYSTSILPIAFRRQFEKSNVSWKDFREIAAELSVKSFTIVLFAISETYHYLPHSEVMMQWRGAIRTLLRCFPVGIAPSGKYVVRLVGHRTHSLQVLERTEKGLVNRESEVLTRSGSEIYC